MTHSFRGLGSRHPKGTSGCPAQVLAIRVQWSRDLLAVVALDESYAAVGAPTVFNSTELNSDLAALEDPRLFVNRGQLYLLAFGLWWGISADGKRQWHALRWQIDGRQYLARIERLPAIANSTLSTSAAGPAGFRITQLRQVLLPEDIPSTVTPSRGVNIRKPHTEKNWVPFLRNDSIHFLYNLNSPVVIRVVADHADADANVSDGIRTEFVSPGSTAVRWRYGGMRGGTPAAYDAVLGGYIAFYHSSMYMGRTPSGDRAISYYEVIVRLCSAAAVQHPADLCCAADRARLLQKA